MAVVMLALVATALPARAAERADAVGKAIVLEPMTLLNTGPLSFGNIAAGTAAGTVVVSPAGIPTYGGGATGLGGEIRAATFLVSVSATKSVRLGAPKKPITLTRVGGGATMQVVAFTDAQKKIRTDPRRDLYEFMVGGTLTVQPNQAEGAYEGQFEVTFDYN